MELNSNTLESNANLIANLMEEIKLFEENLDSDHEALIKLTALSGSVMFSNSIAYRHPDLICFHGTINNLPATMLMHISQLNLTLVAAPIPGERPRRQIGFVLDKHL